jgi:hypothetical protein
MTEGELNADALLRINMAKDEIRNGADEAFSKLPARAATAAEQKFEEEQDDFSTQVIEAFTQSLHNIFTISAGIMVVAFITANFITEKKLRDKPSAVMSE